MGGRESRPRCPPSPGTLLRVLPDGEQERLMFWVRQLLASPLPRSEREDAEGGRVLAVPR